jgi:hypothetical protein
VKREHLPLAHSILWTRLQTKDDESEDESSDDEGEDEDDEDKDKDHTQHEHVTQKKPSHLSDTKKLTKDKEMDEDEKREQEEKRLDKEERKMLKTQADRVCVWYVSGSEFLSWYDHGELQQKLAQVRAARM